MTFEEYVEEIQQEILAAKEALDFLNPEDFDTQEEYLVEKASLESHLADWEKYLINAKEDYEIDYGTEDGEEDE